MNQDGFSMPKMQSTPVDSKIDIQWQQLTVLVQNPQAKKQKKVVSDADPLLEKSDEKKIILDNVSGYARSGELTAIMGPSGAGKTTLVACLSKRFKKTKTQKMSGTVLANDIQYQNYNEFGCFVMQDDLLMATLTVKETFMFAANLRMKSPMIDKIAKVDQVIRDLNLRNCQDTYIGSNMIKGISGGEKKRTCIGVELIADPPVLILDEPTSGLDSFTAFIIMNILRKIAKQQHRTVIFTIHQPSADIYGLFDRIILLNNGQTVYQGEANQLAPYCERIGLAMNQFSNPVDTAINNLNDSLGQEKILTYANYQTHLESVENAYQARYSGIIKRTYGNTYLYELKFLYIRAFTNYMRNPNLLRSKVFGAMFMSVFLGWLFWQVGAEEPPTKPDEADLQTQIIPYLQNMTGALFVCGTSAIFSALGPLLMIFPMERSVFLKEENSKLYRVSSYFLSKVLMEVPTNIFIQMCLSFILYWAFSLRWEFDSVLQFVIISVSVSLCGNGLGLFTGCLFKDAKKSASLGPFFLLPLQIFGGQMVHLESMPKWISWIQYISPFKYFLEGFGRTQLDDVVFVVKGLGVDLVPMEYYGRNFGLWNCIIVLGSIAIGFHVLAAITLKLLVNKINV